ncbi:hypothetical protein [Arsenicicoccus sp. oral taxon 190]|uniref:hypothetical protein n=1 Tax=Arsenicicoccus sp. oral taxon 190 TaxID=1658671 RepID=UPI00067A298A|nr:hypothetical protein [Arsenicicoccus sp. oral taxon 190]AKT50324.1 hypothetical protein ADJ73_01485 [Arsenicicoccus sp. oral taxon 190]
MSDNHNEVQAAKAEAEDRVVERVESWQEGAEQETVAQELREGFEEAGVDKSEDDVERLAKQIHEDGKAE